MYMAELQRHSQTHLEAADLKFWPSRNFYTLGCPLWSTAIVSAAKKIYLEVSETYTKLHKHFLLTWRTLERNNSKIFQLYHPISAGKLELPHLQASRKSSTKESTSGISTQQNKIIQTTVFWGNIHENVSENCQPWIKFSVWFNHSFTLNRFSLQDCWGFSQWKKWWRENRLYSKFPVCSSIFSAWIQKALSIAESYCWKKNQENMCVLSISVLANSSGILCYQVPCSV